MNSPSHIETHIIKEFSANNYREKKEKGEKKAFLY